MPLRILIADDELIERKVLTKIIEDSLLPAVIVDSTGSGRETLESVEKFLPDLIFIDIRMPGMNGLEASALIKQKLPDAVIAIVTAYDEFPYAKQAIDIRIDYFLLKPVEQEEVRRIIKDVLHKKGELEHNSAIGTASGNLSGSRLLLAREILQLLHQNYTEPITLNWLEEHMHVSQQYLGKVFRDTWHRTIMSYLTQYRMKQAAHLLANPELSIADVAEKVGIPDASYFGQLFKNIHHVTPTHYRNQIIQREHKTDSLD